MIVIKAGGNGRVYLQSVCDDVADLVRQGEQVVLVHGGSQDVDAVSEVMGKPAQYVTGTTGVVSRYTDRETMEIFAMVVAGRVNKLLVERLQAAGVDAFGLSGLDGRLLVGQRKATLRVVEGGKQKILHGDFSGKIERVRIELLHTLLAAGLTPVVAPVAVSTAGEMLNVDGDRAAAAIASAMKAERLVILSNVPGLLRQPTDESTLITHIPKAQAEVHLNRYAKGKMKKKLIGTLEALKGGVAQVVIADGRVSHPLLGALAGHGTVIA
ncbi:MAG: [LysW]-aminoadipate kinase [Chloroflexi bacterium]|nr:[LysW]-aminoadipate kinase [Chloroflexota bacterium]